MSLLPGDLVRFPGLIGRERGVCFVLGVSPLDRAPGVKLYVMTEHHKFLTADIYEKSVLAACVERINDR